MTWFFEQPNSVEALKEQLESWRGTPFMMACGPLAQRGVCCDCVSFIAQLLIDLGAIKHFAWPNYVVSGGGEAMLALLLGSLGSIPEFQKVDSICPGDLLVISSGKALHHLAIYAGDNTLWHCERKDGVGTTNLNQSAIEKHLVAVYRVRK